MLMSATVAPIGDTTANGGGKFSDVAVTIPDSFSEFAPQQFFIHAGSGTFSAQTQRRTGRLTGQ
jgi:hypothetical protein